MIHKMNGRDSVIVSDWGKESLILLDPGDGSLLKKVDMTGNNLTVLHPIDLVTFLFAVLRHEKYAFGQTTSQTREFFLQIRISVRVQSI